MGLAAFALLFLAGCQGHKVVARVNNVAITEDEFTERVLRVKGAGLVNTQTGQLNMPANMEIGAKVLSEMIKEELTRQLAEEKHADIKPEMIRGLIEYHRRDYRNPQRAAFISSLSDEELERQLRFSIEDFAIGTNGAKIDDSEIAKKYETTKATWTLPATLAIRSISFPTEDDAKEALSLLNSGKSFSVVAQQLLHLTPAQADANFGRDNILSADYLRTQFPALFDALSAIGPNKFISQPIALQNPTGVGSAPVYIVAQLVKKEPEYIPPLQQIRPFLEQQILSETHPDLQLHASSELAKYTQAQLEQGKIQINIERYKDTVRAYILSQVTAHAIGSSSPAPSRSGAGGAGTSSPPPGSGAAPSSSGGASPNGASPSGSGAASSGSAPSSGTGNSAQPGSGKP